MKLIPIHTGKRDVVAIAREVMGLPKKREVLEADHINRIRLDNRVGNLRVVSQAFTGQNRAGRCRSTSSYRGVHWDKSLNRWKARAGMGSLRWTMYADTELQAAILVSAWRRERMAS